MTDPATIAGTTAVRDNEQNLRRLGFYQGISKGLDALRNQLAPSRRWLDTLDYGLSRDPDAWRKIRRDPVLGKAISFRLKSVAASEWHVEAADRRSRVLVPYFETLIKLCPNLTAAKLALAQAVMTGRGALKVYDGNVRMKMEGDTEVRDWWFPGFLGHIGHLQLRREWAPVTRTNEHGEVIEDRDYYWTTPNLTQPAQPWLRIEPEQEPRYVFFIYNDDSGSIGYGTPDLDMVYMSWYAKTHLWEMLLRHADRYGVPLTVIKTDANQHVGSDEGVGFMTPEDKAAQLLAVFEKMRAGNLMVLDRLDEFATVELEESVGIVNLMEYCDRVGVEAVLASSRPTGGSKDGGSYNLGMVEKQSTDEYIQYDRTGLEEAFQKLIRLIWEKNQHNFRAIQTPVKQGANGYTGGEFLFTLNPPLFRLRDKAAEPSLDALLALIQAGLPVRKADVYKAAGVTQPDADDDVVSAPGAGPGMEGVGAPGLNGPATDIFGNPASAPHDSIPADGITLAEVPAQQREEMAEYQREAREARQTFVDRMSAARAILKESRDAHAGNASMVAGLRARGVPPGVPVAK